MQDLERVNCILLLCPKRELEDEKKEVVFMGESPWLLLAKQEAKKNDQKEVFQLVDHEVYIVEKTGHLQVIKRPGDVYQVHPVAGLPRPLPDGGEVQIGRLFSTLEELKMNLEDSFISQKSSEKLKLALCLLT